MFGLDFEELLVLVVCITGIVWFLDLIWRIIRSNFVVGSSNSALVRGTRGVVDYTKAFFPVLLIVLLLRSFWFEPFRIPSGSMLPTLQVGDFILVNKYEYGVRLPVLDKKVWDVGKPQRGDVMVFKFPHDESVNFIKRVVGIPGDTVVYENKKLIVNGVEVTQESAGMYVIPSPRQAREVLLLNEKIGENQHLILVDENQQSVTMQFTVPNDHYFVLGDNRDYSNDSRFWGYVPEANIVGRAFLIWFSWDGTDECSFWSCVRWDRIGESIE